MSDLDKFFDLYNWSLCAKTTAEPGAKLIYERAEWIGDTPIPWEEVRAEYAALLARVKAAEQEAQTRREELEEAKGIINDALHKSALVWISRAAKWMKKYGEEK